MDAKTWTEWYLDSTGHWRTRQKSGPRPSGGMLVWGVNPYTGKREQHTTYAQSSSGSASAINRLTSSKATTVKKAEYRDSESVARLRGLSREELHQREKTLLGQIERTRRVYRNTRRDAHVLRRNLAKRLRELEHGLADLHTAMFRDTKGRPVHELYQKGDGSQWLGATTRTMEFSLDGRNFSNDLGNIQLGAQVWVHLAYERNNDYYAISGPYGDTTRLLGMVRLLWSAPSGYRALDSRGTATVEYWQTPDRLDVIRSYRAPSSGARSGSFRVQMYEFVPTDNPPATWADETSLK